MFKKRKKIVSSGHTAKKTLRLWPGVVAVILQLLVRFGAPLAMPGGFLIGVLAGIIGFLVIIVWWAFFSRAPRFERWGVFVLIVAALGATWLFKHESMGPLWLVGLVIPVLCLSVVAWAVASRRMAKRSRRIALVAALLLSSGIWLLLRTDGVKGDYVSEFAWRWTESSEERLLSKGEKEQMTLQTAVPSGDAAAEWPGFRGSQRDSIIRGAGIKTNWSESPPVELWRRPVGPGWSSFSVRGGLFYTQEQRGEEEVVACYNLYTGKPVWRHSDRARFFESNGGAGPRGTPTLSNGRVYTLGATGIMNVLNAADGSVVWTRNGSSDTGTKVPMWGFSSSPLLFEDTVIVSLAGSLIAYDLSTGVPRWSKSVGGDCYSSPHPYTFAGVEQILLLNDNGVISRAPADGTLLWEHSWPGQPIVQPVLVADGDILISTGERSGIRRLSVTHESGVWTINELWTSARLKPYFNDSIIHKGHVYGFDGPRLACIDIADGSRKWRGGRYGRGQFVLLADQDILLVLSEKGELALVEATPQQFTELARFPAIEGKTWNHPVLVGDTLLVRNGREMAAFRFPLADN